MEIDIKVKATYEKIKETMYCDDVLDIRYFNEIKENIYDVKVRIPECNLKDSNKVITLKALKNKVVEKCKDVYTHRRTISFENGEKQEVYGSSEYWLDYYTNEFIKRRK